MDNARPTAGRSDDRARGRARRCAVTCPYCSAPAVFLPSSASVHGGRDFGPVYVCRPCEAWVGCHPGTEKPLGRLANSELRISKMKVHAVFDPIWMRRYNRRRAENPDYTRGMARGGRYKRLAELMGIPRADCHIGHFDVERCIAAIRICESGALNGDQPAPAQEPVEADARPL